MEHTTFYALLHYYLITVVNLYGLLSESRPSLGGPLEVLPDVVTLDPGHH